MAAGFFPLRFGELSRGACQRGCEGEAAWGAGRSCAPRGGLSRRAAAAARTGAVCLRARLPGAANAAAARAVCETVASTRLHLQQGFSAGGVSGERPRRKRTAGPGRPARASPRPRAGATGGGPRGGGGRPGEPPRPPHPRPGGGRAPGSRSCQTWVGRAAGPAARARSWAAGGGAGGARGRPLFARGPRAPGARGAPRGRRSALPGPERPRAGGARK